MYIICRTFQTACVVLWPLRRTRIFLFKILTRCNLFTRIFVTFFGICEWFAIFVSLFISFCLFVWQSYRHGMSLWSYLGIKRTHFDQWVSTQWFSSFVARLSPNLLGVLFCWHHQLRNECALLFFKGIPYQCPAISPTAECFVLSFPANQQKSLYNKYNGKQASIVHYNND